MDFSKISSFDVYSKIKEDFNVSLKQPAAG
jgi:hypothetical protein